MALYIDVHKNVNGLTAEAATEAHRKDLAVQNNHNVQCLQYWYNETEGTVFCLIEAPSREAANAVHREAHGLVVDESHEVKEGR